MIRLKFLNYHPIKYRMRGRKTNRDLRNRAERMQELIHAELTDRRMKGSRGTGETEFRVGMLT